MIGQTISHYKILEQIGSGGMGIVYKAEDTKLKRTVALKFLPPELTRDKEAKKRFLHEARAASALDHPNICSIYEIDETEDGQMFMAMAYYEGQTLKDKLTSNPLHLTQAIDIAIQIAEGLNKAHQKGIVHRDIKSANIMVTEDGVVKILDFGLAKLRGATKLTREGTTLGTVAYMSPEQAAGTELDLRSDIWSLGVILYEMLTCRMPFKGEYEQAIMYAIMNEAPQPLTAVRTGIPMQMEHIVKKALQKDPASRYQTLADLIVDLRQITPKAEKPTPEPPPKLRVKRKGFSISYLKWLGIPLAMVLLVAGYIILKQKPSPKKTAGTEIPIETKNSQSCWKNSIAVLPFANISADPEQEYFCDGMTEDIITKLSYIRDLKVISRTSVMAFKNTDKTIRQIGQELGVDNILEGSVRREKNRLRITAQLIRVADDAHLWADKYDRNLESVFQVQEDVSRTIADALEVTLTPEMIRTLQDIQTRNLEAYDYYLKARHIFNTKFLYTIKEEDYTTALSMLNKALEIDPAYTGAYESLAWIYLNHYVFMQDETDLARALDTLAKLKQSAPDSPEYYGYMAMVFLFKGDFDLAYENCVQAVTRMPNAPDINYGFGFFFFRMGLYPQAVKYCSRAMENNPLFLHAYLTAIRCSIYSGNYKAAASYLKKTSELFPGQLMLLDHFCRYTLYTKQYDQAEQWIKKLENTQPLYENIKRWKMILYALRGDRDRALILNVQSEEGYAILNLKEEAVDLMLENINKEKDYYSYLSLIHNPFFQNLFDHPRYQKILADAKAIFDERSKKYRDL
jgi:serine/threonine protein kinase/Tfp pilus assembly protein PilF